MSVGEVLAGQHIDLSSVNRQFSTVSVGAGGGGGTGAPLYWVDRYVPPDRCGF